MRVCVEHEACIGCEVFENQDDGACRAVADTTDENRERVMLAVTGCPAGAIREEE